MIQTFFIWAQRLKNWWFSGVKNFDWTLLKTLSINLQNFDTIKSAVPEISPVWKNRIKIFYTVPTKWKFLKNWLENFSNPIRWLFLQKFTKCRMKNWKLQFKRKLLRIWQNCIVTFRHSYMYFCTANPNPLSDFT